MTAAEQLDQLERSLSPRLLETLALWQSGCSTAKAAAALGVDLTTISRYRLGIRRAARELGLGSDLLPVAVKPAKPKPPEPVMTDREWAASLDVVARCAFCSWSWSGALAPAHAAFVEHKCASG